MIRYAALIAVITSMIAGCKIQLDLGNVGGTDDDVSVIRAQHNGHYYMAFISDRGQSGNPAPTKIWLARSLDGNFGAQTDYVQITTGAASFDVFPTIIQTAENCFHLTWTQLVTATQSYIYYTYTCDPNGLVWNKPHVRIDGVNLTDGQGARPVARGNDILLYVTSGRLATVYNPSKPATDRDIYVIEGIRESNWVVGHYWTWKTPQAIQNLAAEPLHDWFPSVATINGVYWMVFQRSSYDNVFGEHPHPNIFDFDVGVYVALSVDGLNWTSAFRVVHDPDIPHLWPSLNYAPSLDKWGITMTSAAFTPQGVNGLQIFLDLVNVGSFATKKIDVTPLIGGGWGVRAVASPAAKTRIYWVSQPNAATLPQVYMADF